MQSSETWRLEPAVLRGLERSQSELAAEREDYQPSGNWHIWAVPLVLSLGGIVMIASLTSRSGPAGGGAFYWLAFRQLQFLWLGMTLMYFCCLVPLSLIRRFSWLFWFLTVLLTFGTLFPGLGVKVGGARRWLNLSGFQFQPLEILTLGIPLFLADRLAASRREGFECFWKPTLHVAVISAFPLFFQPNMGGIILVFAICMSMHVVDRGWKYPLLGGLFLSLVFIVMIYIEPYRMRRLLAFLNPWDDPLDKGFQIIQGLVAFSNGGIMGVGVGKGLQKLNYLPAAHTDYIFPAIGEEFGLAGTLFIILLYAFWTFKAYTLYRRCNDPYMSALIWGVTVSVLFPMFINLGGVMKLMPLTGIPLPFLSFGGTALVVMWVKVGILM
ncbi:MAG: putative lipid II flippase FtsW, partial [Synergistaceae bacterium]|nr:putative lipid II flippase FtsW [Synergistaceae bacterium]